MIVQVATLGPLGRLKAPGTRGSAACLLWSAPAMRFALLKGGPPDFIFVSLLVLTAIPLCGDSASPTGMKDTLAVLHDAFAAITLVGHL